MLRAVLIPWKAAKRSAVPCKWSPPVSGCGNRYYTYACKNCEQEIGETVVECAFRAPSVLPGSFAFPSAIAYIATQKYVIYSLLYRLE